MDPPPRPGRRPERGVQIREHRVEMGPSTGVFPACPSPGWLHSTQDGKADMRDSVISRWQDTTLSQATSAIRIRAGREGPEGAPGVMLYFLAVVAGNTGLHSSMTYYGTLTPQLPIVTYSFVLRIFMYAVCLCGGGRQMKRNGRRNCECSAGKRQGRGGLGWSCGKVGRQLRAARRRTGPRGAGRCQSISSMRHWRGGKPGRGRQASP